MSSLTSRKRKTGTYIRVREAKIRAKNPSSTKGIEKGENCRKHPLMVQFAKDSRMDRTEPLNYAKACRISLIRNKFDPNL